MENWKRKFAVLSIGQAVSMLTSSILQISIVWYLTQKTGSAAVVTTSALAGFLPRGILGLFTGVLIDRYDRKTIVILSDSIIALCALGLAAVAFFSEIPILLIYFMLFIRSVGAAFHSPSFQAIIPTIVPREELPRCAGFVQGFESLSLILSPALAAVLYDLWDLGFIILLDVLGAVIAVTLVLVTPLPKNTRERSAELHLLRDTAAGLHTLKEHRGMLSLMIVSTLYAFVYYPIGSMYPLISMTYFGGTIRHSSAVEIAFSAGSLLGAFLLGIWGKKVNKISAIAASIGIYGLGTMCIGLLPPTGFLIFMVLSWIMGLTIPFFYGLRTAIFQGGIPNEYLGRVLSLTYSASLFTGPLGLILSGAFSDHFGVNRCFFFLGCLAAILSLVTLASPSLRSEAHA